MKKTILRIFVNTNILLSILILVNCSKKTDHSPVPEDNKGCKIASIVSESSSMDQFGAIASHSKGEQLYEYNENLYPILSKSTNEIFNGSTPIFQIRNQEIYTYDANNFLKSSAQSNVNESMQNGQIVLLNSNSDANFEYKEGRLIESTATQVRDTTVIRSSVNYEYAANGKLTKYSIFDQGNSIISIFSNGVLVSYSESYPANASNVIYNAMGFQTSNKFSAYGNDYEARNTHDTAGNLIKTERLTNSVIESYTTNTYGQLNTQGTEQPEFKGHPKIPSRVGSNANLMAQSVTYNKKQNGGDFYKSSESIFEYEFNSSGYFNVKRTTGKIYDEMGNVYITSLATNTYTYVGCKL